MKQPYTLFFMLALLACTEGAQHRAANNSTGKVATANPETLQTANKKNAIMDNDKLSRSHAVIKARLINTGTGDKFIWDTVKVEKVLHNSTDYKFPPTLIVARYSWDSGISCDGIFTLYLNIYPLGSKKLNEHKEWMLLDGKAASAVVCD